MKQYKQRVDEEKRSTHITDDALAGGDIGSDSVLHRYDRLRRSESETMAFGMHALRSLFGNESISPVRRAGLAIVKRSWVIRDMFLQRAAGVAERAVTHCCSVP